jgi:hypothetical protein
MIIKDAPSVKPRYSHPGERQPMTDVKWTMEHSVEANVSPAFAWNFMTNVGNWDDPPARFELDGPFAPGAKGITRIPGQEDRHWQVLNVTPAQSYTLVMPLEGADLSFEWRFEACGDTRTRLTQQIVLRGDHADTFLSDVRLAFTSSPAGGMAKIAAAMERAAPE